MSFNLTKKGLRQPVRLLICGDRDWKNEDLIMKKLRKLQSKTGLTLTVITGGCRGADQIADKCAEFLGIDRIVFPANWKGRGRSAGPIRNRKQYNEGRPNLVWAFHHFIGESTGTKDMVKYALNQGCHVEVFKDE